MSYDERLAERVREQLAARSDFEERKMFGGLAFLRRGHMVLGVVDERLMVRVGPDRHDDALARTGAEPMDFTGRPMKGMVFVEPVGYRTGAQLRRWLDMALEFEAGLPAKSKRPQVRAR